MSQSQSEGLGTDILAMAGLQPAGYQALCPADQEMQHNTEGIVAYLLDRVPEFRRLAELRRKGWENPAVDTYFKIQRCNADKTDETTSRYHFRLMSKIGKELHDHTLGFATKTCPGSVLDMCAAPGGFLATATKLNPGCKAVGFSLPPSDGGYNVVLGGEYKDCVKFLDITMLADDMGVTEIPDKHPDAGNFLPRQIEETQLFNLVLCDGHVLRNTPQSERLIAERVKEPD